jgi:hypothetical protein
LFPLSFNSRPLAAGIIFINRWRKTMKSKLLTAVFGVAVLLVLVTCDTGTSPPPVTPTPPASPIKFFGIWKEPNNSYGDIVQGPRSLEVKSDWSFVYIGGETAGFDALETAPTGAPTILAPVIFMGAPSLGGFSQAKQDLNLSGFGTTPGPWPASFLYYPPIIVEGKLIYEGDGYYTMAPDKGRIDLRLLRALNRLANGPTDESVPEYNELPDTTIQNFREYAKISLDTTGRLVIDDDPATVNGGVGFLDGTWDIQP